MEECVHLQIHSRGLRVTDATRMHVERRLNFALDRFSGRVGSITVRLCDLNGPRGGRDKSCSVELNVIPLGRIVIDERADSVSAAIDMATDRLGTSMARLLKRARRGRSSSIRHLCLRPDTDAA